ncbi:MAG: hypothetical protein IM551_03660 [Chitinophagaceae bacterium]|nr:hypothetical protein [Chitinophagaceae bacterium]
MDFSKTLFRCSSLGHIMTEARGAGLSETTKTHLINVYVSNKYGRRDDIQGKYIEKGLAVEEDSITLYSRIKQSFFKKNDSHISNSWIKGTPDLYEGFSIEQATHIVDIKSSWDIYTFMRVLTKDVNKMYYWQLQGYMDLTGATSATLAYCLVDTPAQLIEDEKRRLMWKMGVATSENPLYLEACDELDKAMTFGDIPMEERLIEFKIERNEADIMKMHARVEECRKWLNEFESSRIAELV